MQGSPTAARPSIGIGACPDQHGNQGGIGVSPGDTVQRRLAVFIPGLGIGARLQTGGNVLDRGRLEEFRRIPMGAVLTGVFT